MNKTAQQSHEVRPLLCSVVDSGRGREVKGWGWLLARVAAAAYAKRWALTQVSGKSIMEYLALLRSIEIVSFTILV